MDRTTAQRLGDRTMRLVTVLVAVTATGCGMASHGARTSAATPIGGAVVASIPLPDYGADIAIRRDGARAYVPLRTNKVVAIDVASARVAATIPMDYQPAAIALDPAGTRAYVMDLTAQSLFVVDTQNDRLLKRLPVGVISRALKTPSVSVAVAPDGRHAYVTNATRDDDHLLIVDTATDTIVKDQFLPLHPVGVAVSPDGATVYVAGCRLSCIDGTLLALDATTAAVVAQVALAAPPANLALGPDGGHAYLANGRDATVTVVDVARQAVIETIPVGAQPLGIAAGPRGRFVLVASFGESRIDVIDTVTNTVVAHVAVAREPRAIAVSGDGRIAVVTHTAPTCSVIDLARVLPHAGR